MTSVVKMVRGSSKVTAMGNDFWCTLYIHMSL